MITNWSCNTLDS